MWLALGFESENKSLSFSKTVFFTYIRFFFILIYLINHSLSSWLTCVLLLYPQPSLLALLHTESCAQSRVPMESVCQVFAVSNGKSSSI